ncbi:MAG: hypothetical protein ACOX52_02970 [Verrucomicrobiota bacterium]
MDRSNFAAKLCQNRNNTVPIPGFSCPYPTPRSFDTETDSDPDPDRASPWTFSDDLYLVPAPPQIPNLLGVLGVLAVESLPPWHPWRLGG